MAAGAITLLRGRLRAVLFAGGAAAIAMAGCGGSHGAGAGAGAGPARAASTTPGGGTAAPAGPATLRVIYVAQFRAKVLADAGGYSLYIFGPDHRRGVTCSDACALSWPPLEVPAGTKPRPGPGVAPSLVGVVSSSGADVVTYNSWPLYTYVADVSPGMASGEGINLNGGPWYLMEPDGDPLVPTGQPQPLGDLGG
ncbi:MAG TPA: hypothetical protein VL984_16565 [Acidimicrobiales bacterium]|nr:hypothetical protein [Acidimicrobiales bacterium]